MPLRLNLDLSESDLEHFADVAQRTCADAALRSHASIIEGARELLGRAEQAHAPQFVRQKFVVLERLLAMLDDSDWAMVDTDQRRAINALACLSDAPSADTQASAAVAALDYAIIIELIQRDLQHDLAAYEEFCKFRTAEASRVPRATSRRHDPAERLRAKRELLQTRMHERRRRDLERAQAPWRKFFAVFGL
jgi:hypothetical protein